MAKRMYQTSIAFNWREEDEKHPATHMLLSLKEYDRMCDDIEKAQSEAYQAKLYAKQQIESIRKNAEAEKEQIRKTYEADHNYQWDLLNQKEAEIKRLTGLNEDLLRVARERANADRKMKPKKERSGYRLIKAGATRKNVGYNKNSGAVYADAWETVLESPYQATIPLEEIDREIYKELKEKVLPSTGAQWAIFKGDPDSIWKGNYNQITEEEKKKAFIFDYDFSINPKTYRWMISLITTSAITVSKDLMG